MRGRKAKPLSMKIAEGVDRPRDMHAAIRATADPRRTLVLVDCPSLSKEAQAYWPAFRSLFADHPVVAASDLAAVGLMVETYAEYMAAKRLIEVEGRTYTSTTEGGGTMVRAHPAVAMVSDTERRLRSWFSEFGLTPAARMRVMAAPTDPSASDGTAEFES